MPECPKDGCGKSTDNEHGLSIHWSLKDDHEGKLSDVDGYNPTRPDFDNSGENNGMYGKQHSEETKRQMSENRSGSGNANWQGGVSEYWNSDVDNWHSEIRPTVLDRDEHECQNCGATDEEVSLNVHHIVPVEEFDDMDEAHDLDNLILVCKGCHIRHHSPRANLEFDFR